MKSDEFYGSVRPTKYQIRYGPHTDNNGDLYIPPKPREGTWPVVVMIHGGFWQNQNRKDLNSNVAYEIAEANLAATFNIEYRRCGSGGSGGFPETFLDVAAAIDFVSVLAGKYPLDTSKVVVVGHNAGGHLAAWSAMRGNLPSNAPGANPVIQPSLVISQSGVLDLEAAYDQFIGGYAVPSLLRSRRGGRVDPSLFAITSPSALLPSPSKFIIVHAQNDKAVPLWMSEKFQAKAKSMNCDSELLIIPDEDHFSFLDIKTKAHHSTMYNLQKELYPNISKEYYDLKKDLDVERVFHKATNEPFDFGEVLKKFYADQDAKENS